MSRSARTMAAVGAGALVMAALFLLGRLTAPQSSASTLDQYFDGLRTGAAQGRQEGRALQAGAELPPAERGAARKAFDAGYAAGANDVFAGYDGGWQLQVPWLVTLEGGIGQVVYRIRDRRQVQPGYDYYLCPDGRSLCSERRH